MIFFQNLDYCNWNIIQINATIIRMCITFTLWPSAQDCLILSVISDLFFFKDFINTKNKTNKNKTLKRTASCESTPTRYLAHCCAHICLLIVCRYLCVSPHKSYSTARACTANLNPLFVLSCSVVPCKLQPLMSDQLPRLLLGSWGIYKDKWYYVKFHLMTNF